MKSKNITNKQKEIVGLMQQGFSLMIGTSETTGKQYYMIASTHNNGYSNTYFRGDIFANLLLNDLIYFSNRSFDYELTEKGENLKV